ncbi:MAG: hypothetical protein K0U41_08630 [Gammaproteobacteria bacterium]|nr:hypothetical protein [Gammaproteobacteria bacterium]
MNLGPTLKENLLILVKTYPTISEKYMELVCTAGINENGEWRRVYPIPFRELNKDSQYKKYQWVEVELRQNLSDGRKESYKLHGDMKILKTIDTGKDGLWQERKETLFKSTKVYEDMNEIIELNKSKNIKDKISLAIFKPQEILDFKVEAVERSWNAKKIEAILNQNSQGILFPDIQKHISVVPKVPYKFSYKFKDINGKESTLMIEDWEVGQLYWNCIKSSETEKIAIDKVRAKYLDTFVAEKDIYLFLGTTKEFDGWSSNPFIIIGVFYPKKELNKSLF